MRAVLLLAVILLTGVGAYLYQLRQERVLRRNAQLVARQTTTLQALRDENGRLTEKTKRAPVRVASAAGRSATSAAARAGQAQDDLEKNRDPERGATRLEHFRNVGNATPAAAFQTLVWAIVKGEDSTVASLLAFTPTGRAKLDEYWSALPSESRTRFKNPENLVTALLAAGFLEQEGFRIGETKPTGPQSATVNIQRQKNNRLQRAGGFVFTHGPSGWQCELPDSFIDDIPQRVVDLSVYVPPPPYLDWRALISSERRRGCCFTGSLSATFRASWPMSLRSEVATRSVRPGAADPPPATHPQPQSRPPCSRCNSIPTVNSPNPPNRFTGGNGGTSLSVIRYLLSNVAASAASGVAPCLRQAEFRANRFTGGRRGHGGHLGRK